MIVRQGDWPPQKPLGIKDDALHWNKKQRRNSIIWLTVAVISLCLNFLPNDLIDPFSYDLELKNSSIIKNVKAKKYDDEYNSKLAPRFQDLDAVVYYVKKHTPDTENKLQQFEILTKLIRQRFVHAYSVYGMQENWIAVLAGRFIWRDLSAKVIPDDILKGEIAACSQVSIVLMAACKRLGIPSRKIGLQGHYAMEAYINNEWYFADANLKPNFAAINGRKSIAAIVKNNEQFNLYANTILDSNDIAHKFSKIVYGPVNDNPAPRAHFFQATTKELSHWGWIIPLTISIFYWRSKKTTNTEKLQFAPEFLQQFRALIP